ncbi:hypothetical protein IJI31_04795, partial [bacterium]|nr:hypothetical protein [bacterium]
MNLNFLNLWNIKKSFKNFKISVNDFLIKQNYKRVIKKLRNKKKIKVVFLCSESSKWNYAKLYEKLENYNLFEPEIVLYPHFDKILNKNKISV